MVSDGAEVIFERNPDTAVTPASTMKLLTATAALTQIDPDARLRTPVVAAAAPSSDGTVEGDLFLVGGGDPVLGTLPYGAHFPRQPRLLSTIEVLADRVVAAGVRHVTGRIVGDDGRYERLRYLPSWPSRYQSDHETGPLSALTVNDGFERWSPLVAFADPAAGAAGVFNDLLRERGVVVDGGPASGTAPAQGVELAALDSPTIAELVDAMLLDSDNNTAELLLRELGLRVLGAGTTDAGRRVVADALSHLGLPMAGVTIVDGSGLDRGDRVTCRLLNAILTSSPVKTIVTRGLPIAAQTGTLYKRFLATPVAGHLRAKTGSITSVAGLAGYADGADGGTLTFAYEQNNVGGGEGQDRQNELGHTLVLTRR
jgi:serine-type D-Ala-D-Ala carboxypeptidase/endopeptidase (penicillin-binding protein 4)